MKKKINEEKNRIIALFGINEQEETVMTSPKEKLKKIKFYDVKMKPIEFTADEEDTIVSKVESVMQDGSYGDNAIVRAAVTVKGGKDEPFIKYGSFATDSEVINRDTIFDENEILSDGDNVRDYFEIVMTGPDIDDYKIVRVESQKLSEPETDKEEKVTTDVETKEPVQQQPEQPFEEEMKHKEKKGLATLLDGGEPEENTFTKRQKKVLDKLKGEGYLLNRPENVEGYTKKRVTSKEFTESFNVWEPKK